MFKMSRRDFVKISGTGLALATLPGFVRRGMAGVVPGRALCPAHHWWFFWRRQHVPGEPGFLPAIIRSSGY